MVTPSELLKDKSAQSRRSQEGYEPYNSGVHNYRASRAPPPVTMINICCAADGHKSYEPRVRTLQSYRNTELFKSYVVLPYYEHGGPVAAETRPGGLKPYYLCMRRCTLAISINQQWPAGASGPTSRSNRIPYFHTEKSSLTTVLYMEQSNETRH
ncbi:hypothetical protein EVAR_65559_1 [Eumeta japonica]|uniref:Uncharacterized protein n=1 Tax=Eumeta variegata TaxID=151549 RepID=A0A4C1ZBY8_EUMVA|nr:hypothetical protein EVAR_65559_1 [Eumeta japonica]